VWVSSENDEEPFDNVTDLHWVEGSSATLAWTAVADANYYSVKVYVYDPEDETLIGTIDNGTTITELDVQQEIHRIIGDTEYDYVKARAIVFAQKRESDVVVSQSKGVETSFWTYHITPLIKLDAPVNVTLSDDFVAQFYCTSEDIDNSVDSAVVEVLFNGEYVGMDISYPSSWTNGSGRVDIKDLIKTQYRLRKCTGKVNVTVRAWLQGKAGYYSSDFSKESSVAEYEDLNVQLEAPLNVKLSEDYIAQFDCKSDCIEDGVDSAVVEVLFNGEYVGMDISYPSSWTNGSGRVDIKNLIETQYRLRKCLGKVDVTVRVWIQAKAGYYSSEYSTESNAVEYEDVHLQLEAPTNVKLLEGFIAQFDCKSEYIEDGVDSAVVEVLFNGEYVGMDISYPSTWVNSTGQVNLQELVKTYYRIRNFSEEVRITVRVWLQGKTGYWSSDYSLESNTQYYDGKEYVQSLSITPEKPLICLNHSYYLGKTIAPVSAYYENIDWSSDKPDIVSVDGTGKITAISVGTANITAKIGDASDTVPVTVYEITSNIDNQSDKEQVTDTAGEIIDDIANNDNPDLSNTDIAPENLEDIKEDIQEGIENGDTFHTDIVSIQQYFDQYKNNWGQIQKAATYLNAQFEGAYNIEVEMYHKDKDGGEHVIGNIIELPNEVSFSFDLPNGESGKAKRYVLVRIHKNSDGEEEYTPIEYTDNGNGTITTHSNKFSDFVLLSVEDESEEKHEHDFVFSVDKDTITASCQKENCDLQESSTYVELIKPELQISGEGKSPEARLGNVAVFNMATGLTVSADNITYVGTGETKYDESKTPPTEIGTYQAKLTISDLKTADNQHGTLVAFADYEIEEAFASVITKPEANELEYDGTEKTLVTAGTARNGEILYALTVKNDSAPTASDYKVYVPSATKPGTYFVWYKVAGYDGYSDYIVTDPIEVIISKATNPTEVAATAAVARGGYSIALLPLLSNVTGDVTFSISGEMNGCNIHDKEFVSGSKTGVVNVEVAISETEFYASKKEIIKISITGSNETAVIKETGELEVRLADAEGYTEDGLAVYTYTGSAIKPDIIVTNGNKTLTLGIDYKLSYKNNIKASENTKTGKATVQITGIGQYAGKYAIDFIIACKDIGSEDVILGNTVVQSGKMAAPVLTYNGVSLKNNTDYSGVPTSTIKGNDDSTFEVIGKGNFKGKRSITVKVLEKNQIKAFTVTLNTQKIAFTYNGEPKTLNGEQLVVTERGKKDNVLHEGTDYNICYSGNIDAGKVYVTITGTGEYSGTVKKDFKIGPAKTASFVTINGIGLIENGVSYSRLGVKPELKIIANIDDEHKEIPLVLGKDYKVSYSKNTKVGTGHAKVTLLGNYKGAKAFTQDFTILPAEMTSESVELTIRDFVYNSKKTKASNYFAKNGSTMFVTMDGVLLNSNEYSARYYQGEQELNSKSVLTFDGDVATIRVEVKPNPKNKNYTLAENILISKEYKVIKKTGLINISTAKVTVVQKNNQKKLANIGYTGKAIIFDKDEIGNQDAYIKVVIKDGKKTITLIENGEEGTDQVSDYFDIIYVNNTRIGTAKIILIPRKESSYTGSAIGSFKIKSSSLVGKLNQWVG
jgi:hypothetical protein